MSDAHNLPKVSVIVPCYNSSEFLGPCICSLKKQTLGMENLEVIFVNDASTDNGATTDVLKEFEQHYPQNVCIIELSENLRQGGARNVGIKYATGDYIFFLDSDDWLTTDALEYLVNVADERQCDVVEFKYIRAREYTDEYTGRKTVEKSRPKYRVIDNIDSRKDFIMNGQSGRSCMKLYKRGLIQDNGIRFAENISWEEPAFTYPVQFYENRHAWVDAELYFALIRDDSTMKSSYDAKKFDNPTCIDSLYNDLMARGLDEHYREEIEYIFFHWFYYSTFIFAVMNNTFFTADEYEKIRQITCGRITDIRKNKYYLETFGDNAIIGDLLYMSVDNIDISNVENFFRNFTKIYLKGNN